MLHGVLAEFGIQRVILANLRESLEFCLAEFLSPAVTGILDHPESKCSTWNTRVSGLERGRGGDTLRVSPCFDTPSFMM